VELGVRYVLEGSVRKAANRVRITGQLIDRHNNRRIQRRRPGRPAENCAAALPRS
jgi:TolB-like protein